MPPAKGSPQSWINQGMGSGALAPFRLTWMHGGRQWGPLTSAAGQECRLHTSSPQEALSEDIVEYLEDHIQENLPVSWSHCLSAFLHLPLASLVLGAGTCAQSSLEWGVKGVPEISGGAALLALASPLSARGPEPWTQLPA